MKELEIIPFTELKPGVKYRLYMERGREALYYPAEFGAITDWGVHMLGIDSIYEWWFDSEHMTEDHAKYAIDDKYGTVYFVTEESNA